MLRRVIEMILDNGLVAARDENEMLDARLARLLDAMLQDGTIHDRQHFLGNDLGGRQHAGAKAGDGKHGFTDTFFHVAPSSLSGYFSLSRV